MTQQTSAIHTSHKLLWALLLLVAFCVPFIFAGASGSLSHQTLEAGSGVLSGNQQSTAMTTHDGRSKPTVSTAAGQSLVNVTVK